MFSVSAQENITETQGVGLSYKKKKEGKTQ